jgi:hypothetical protein
MLWACVNLQEGQNNTFECFEDQLSFLCTRGAAEVEVAIFGYFFDDIVLAINNARNPS